MYSPNMIREYDIRITRLDYRIYIYYRSRVFLISFSIFIALDWRKIRFVRITIDGIKKMLEHRATIIIAEIGEFSESFARKRRCIAM